MVLDPATIIQFVFGGLFSIFGWMLRQGVSEIKADIKTLMLTVGDHRADIKVLEARVMRVEESNAELREQFQQLDRRASG